MKLAALLFIVLQFIAPAAAQGSGPEELVRQVTADVLAAVQSDQALAAGDRRKALALAEAKILPHVDFREATRLAVNRAWASATAEQQDRIVAEFRSMLVRIYAASVDVYRGQVMRVQPLGLEPGAIEATVRNQYLSPGQTPVPVDYAMRKTPEGWKVYDITVGGVSLVLTFRSEFEQVMRQSGIEGLIKRMSDKNRAG
jgi:phospholipid transport system substrate-binding protein